MLWRIIRHDDIRLNCTLSQSHQLKNNIFFNTEHLQTGIMIFLFSYLGQSGSTSTIKLVMQVQQLCKCLSFTTVNEPITHTHTTLFLLTTSLHEKRPLKVKSHSSGIQWIPLYIGRSRQCKGIVQWCNARDIISPSTQLKMQDRLKVIVAWKLLYPSESWERACQMCQFLEIHTGRWRVQNTRYIRDSPIRIFWQANMVSK